MAQSPRIGRNILLALCAVTVALMLVAQETSALPWSKKSAYNEREVLNVESSPPDGYAGNGIVKRQVSFGGDIIDCYYTTFLCLGPRILPANGMTIDRCCVNIEDGIAYSKEGGEAGCRLCVVFGWYQQFFEAPESLSQTYSLLAGFHKGGEEHTEDLMFNVVPEYSGSFTPDDITLITQSVTLKWEENSPSARVEFKLNRDRDDREGDETFTLRLYNAFLQPFSENYFPNYEIQITIQDTPALCLENGINCDDSGCDRCLPRFTGQGCCDCENDYYLNTDTLQCEAPCEDTTVGCNGGVCTCSIGFAQPDCCECDEFSYDHLPNNNQIDCTPTQCRVGVEKCSGGVCTCKTGYTGIDCCRCESDHFRDGDECKPACANNIDECSNGRCICQEGYSGPGCCDCANLYIRDAVTDRCIAPCFEGVESCSEQECICSPGYSGIDCCGCTVTHYRDSCLDICTLIELEGDRDDLVDCFTENQCGGTRRRMSRELCCVQSRGVSYSAEGDEFGCRTCVVFGWIYDCPPFIQPERAQPYELAAGYLKGNEELDENFEFQIKPVLQTASLEDFSLSQTTVEVLASDTELKLVGLTLVEDGVALEPNEVFSLDLVINGGQEPSGDNIFFLKNQTIIIRDVDVKCSVGIVRCGRDPLLCACRPGYKDPDCCDCEDDYFKDPDNGQCFLPCPEGALSCTNGICLCNDGYTGIDCCDCDVGYYRDTSTQTCQEYCDPGVLAGCSTDPCQCDTGYTGPGCCECATGYERNGDTCVEMRCSLGVVSCSRNRCICKEGYSGPKCCDCASGYYRDQSNTSICVAPCFEGTVGCTDDGGCTCRPGYMGADCCNCDSTYYRSRCSNDVCTQIEIGDGDNAVDCFTEGNCRGTRRRMTPELCCVESNGVSFQSEGTESCTVCVVYGWNDTCAPFRAPERKESYSCELGYIKGNEELGEDFTWRLQPRLINASSEDFVINTQTVNVRYESTDFEEARVTFVVDGIAQERDETFEIDLVFDDVSQPNGNNFFFLRTKVFTIIDVDTTCEVGTDSCDNNECTCKAEYLPPSCCDCIDGYYRDENGVCQLPCSRGVSRCTNNVCTCNRDYTGPRCCYCANGVSNCSSSGCTCKKGYTGADCCDCAQDFEKDGDECTEKACPVGVVSCSSTRCICKEGYSGPKCCDCASGYYKDQSNTSICVAPCFEGTVGCTDDGGCTCRPGYVGADCCDCDSTYYRSRCSGGCSQIELQDDDTDAVDCFTEGNCRGTRRRMTPELCCVESNGVSYQSEGAESCTVCIVYGWKDTCAPFRAPERKESYSCELGYVKGNEELGEDFTWRLQPQLINASNSDFTINTQTVSISYQSSSFENARFTFVVDGIAKEPDEFFEIDLEFDDIPDPTREGVFFLKKKTLIIIDADTTCTNGTLSCTQDGVCMCKDGYLPPECCDCADGYFRDENGECTRPCQTGVFQCSNEVCICKTGFAEPDCCDCADGYYRDGDECKLPETECVPGILACTRGVCRCLHGHIGIDCCECDTNFIKNEDTLICESCSAVQDIYFVIDTTTSFRSIAFCEVVYGLQLIAEAIQPLRTINNTRIGAYLYPPDRDSPPDTMQFLKIGEHECSDILSQLHYLTLVVSFDRQQSSDEKTITRAKITSPASVLKVLINDIRKEIAENSELANRRRVVLIVTDGTHDDNPESLTRNVTQLINLVPNNTVTLISAGLIVDIDNDRETFQQELITLANNIPENAVLENSTAKLVKGIVRRMRLTGAICESQEQQIIANLNEQESDKYCGCYFRRYYQVPECPCRNIPENNLEELNACREQLNPTCDSN